MAKKSRKQQNITGIQTKFDGGVNYSDAPSNIADNELTRALNIIYDSQTGTPVTRPGTAIVSAAALASPIRALYYYERTAATAGTWLIGASGLKLLYFDVDHWHEIGTDALGDDDIVPFFVTFNNVLLVADGVGDIRSWDGVTLTTLTAPKASALTVIKGRVVANAVDEPDAVYFSKPSDHTVWTTGVGEGIGLRAGFGDSLDVNAFAVTGNDLIVSKKGAAEKRFYRVNVADATAANWYVENLSENNCAQNAQCMLGAFNNVYFIDTNGFKSIKGVTEYGDLQTDLIGSKVNTLFGSSQCDGMVYLPLYTAIWYFISTRVFCYHKTADDAGNVREPFTDLIFNQGRIRCACQVDDTVYLGGHDGHLYKMDDTIDTDVSVVAGSAATTTGHYNTVIKTKRFSFFGQGILRRCEMYLKPLKAGSAVLSLVTPQNEAQTLSTITLRNAGTEIYDATGEINDATSFIYDGGTAPWFETTYNRARGSSFQWQLLASSGRVGIEGLKAEVALVEGA